MTARPYLRFTLSRMFERLPLRRRLLGFCMLNPSTALEVGDIMGKGDDATIRSCIRIAKANDYDGILVVNVSPYRATDPRDLIDSGDAGIDIFHDEENNRHIEQAAGVVTEMVVAWGANVGEAHQLGRRADEVLALLCRLGTPTVCLGRTKDGYPKHPCRLAAKTPLVPFEATP